MRGGIRVQDEGEKNTDKELHLMGFFSPKKYVANFKNNMGTLETKWKSLRKLNCVSTNLFKLRKYLVFL